jgi:hypothetical protein
MPACRLAAADERGRCCSGNSERTPTNRGNHDGTRQVGQSGYSRGIDCLAIRTILGRMVTRKCDRRESRSFRHRIVQINRGDPESHLRARGAGRPANSHADAWVPGTLTLFGTNRNRAAAVQLLASWPGQERLSPEAIPVRVRRFTAPSQRFWQDSKVDCNLRLKTGNSSAKTTEPRCQRREWKLRLDSILYMQHMIGRERDCESS